MSPHWAVAWAAFFNFVAFLVFGFAVATTIGKGIVDPAIVDHYVVFGALCGAIAWNLITWYYGIRPARLTPWSAGSSAPVSRKAGVGKLVASGVLKTAVAIVLSPLFGFMLAITLMIAVSWIFARATRGAWTAGSGGCSSSRPRSTVSATAATTRKKPWVSSGCCSSHPGFQPRASRCPSGLCSPARRRWAWDALRRLAHRQDHGHANHQVEAVGGFVASASGAMTLFLATALGIPVSTTHTITGSIIGVARCRSSRRCAGAWPATSSGHGFSPSRAPRS